MITIQKKNNQKYVLEYNNIKVKTFFYMWKIWLNKKEIADIYWVKKKEIKRELNSLLLNSSFTLDDNIQKIYNKERWRKENFYSLDILLLLWYNSKHYKETKFLINTNKMIKEYALSRKHNLNSLSWDNILSNFLNNIINYKRIIKA